MSDKYCSKCIHSMESMCMLSERLNYFCKEHDLMFWFPDLSDENKIRLISDTMKSSFNISEKEAPHNHQKKSIINDLEAVLKPKNSCKCKMCGRA